MATATLGRYQILSELGQGAMGTVYKAIDPLIERTVAIKTITLGVSKEEFKEFEERFYREAKSAGRLNHPNIVTIFDIGNTGNVAWIAMELLEGQSLREVIDSGAVLPAEKIARIGAQVAQGLAAAHAAHVVHRDIKPANIMIQSNGHAKITDFGVALIPASSRTMDGVILGSPKYMSPEHVVGRAVDGRSDIFSLGAVLYELLAGRPPFEADHVANLMYKVLNELPPAPSTIFRSVPPGLDYIVAKAMAKHPDDRYASADLLAADLRRYNKLPPPEPVAKPRTLERRRSKRAKPEELSLDQQTVVEELVPGRRIAPHADDEIIDITAAPASRRNPAANDGTSMAARRPALLAAAAALALAALAAVAYLNLTPAPLPTPPVAEAPPPAPPAPAVQPAAEPTTVAAAMPAGASTEPAPPVVPQSPTPGSAGIPSSRNADVQPARRSGPKPETSSARTAVPVEPRAAAAGTSGESAPNAASGSATAQIEFAVTPWGEIYVNGKRQGTTPPDTQLSLPAGTHRVEIRNGDFPPHVQTVDLKPGQSLRLKHRFAQ